MLNETLKIVTKIMSADIKTDAKQEIEELVAVSNNFSERCFLKS